MILPSILAILVTYNKLVCSVKSFFVKERAMERDFKGIWIPKEVWLDERLGVLDKVILMEIDSLDVDDDGCYASNEYLADFCQCTETKVSTSISKLIKLLYLEVVKFDGRKRYLKSRVKKIERLPLKNLKADFKNFKDINIINNINNNKKENIIKKKYGEFKNVLLTDEEYQKLKDRFNDYEEKIENLSYYLKSKGDKYKSHYGTILNWARKDEKDNKLPDWFNKKIEKKEDEEIDRIAKELTNGTWRP